MLNVTMIADIAAVAAAISQTSLQNFVAAAASSRDYRQQEWWNSADIDFFDSNFDDKFAFIDEAVIHASKNIYYRDVHVFVERIKKMIIVLESEMIKKNLSSCLRESVLMWHIAKLFDVSRRILFYEKNVNEWMQALIDRFKTQVITTIVNLLRERYTLTNAERNRESRKYVQKIIKWVKFAKMTSSFNQLNIVYNEIDAKLRRDLKKSSKNITIDDYLQLLNDCKDIWWSLTTRNQKYSEFFTNYSNFNDKQQFQFNSSFRFYDNRSAFSYQQRYNNWNSQNNQKNVSFNNERSYINSYQSFQNHFNQNVERQRQFNRNFQESYQQQFTQQQIRRTSSQSFNETRNVSRAIMLSSENFQTKSQQDSWQNRQFQKSEINYQIKSQRMHFEDYDFQYDENWTSKLEQNSSTYYENDEYYENRSYDEILKISAESENMQSAESDQKISEAHFEKILKEELADMTNQSQLTLKCRLCEMKFYSNNKLHRHLRSNQHARKHQESNASIQNQNTNISIITSIRKHANQKSFVFREHQYARVKRTFDSKNNIHDLCANSKTFMFLIDREFLEKNVSNVEVKKTEFNLKMREIEFKTHDTFEYCSLDLYFRESFKKKLTITHIRKEFHLMNVLNVNVLIDINVMRLEKCILNFKRKIMIFFVCENTEVLIIIIRTDKFVNRSLLIADKTVVSSHTNMTILVKIREKSLSKRDYIFNSKSEILLDLEKNFFSHILINNSVRILMKNISNQAYEILKNYKLSKICDYQKGECFLIFSNDKHLIVVLNKLFSQSMNSRRVQTSKDLKRVLSNEIIVHENTKAIRRIANVINRYLDVWKNISETINVSKKRWMRIKIISETNSETCRVYKLEIENQTIIDKKFDALHVLRKMKWAFEFISYAYSIFVIWTIIHLMKKSFTRRDKVMIDIRDLNKISKHDAYSMSLQLNILSKTQDCSYISIMNCITFFHQWRVVISDKHKLIVVTHRDVEQWNVDVMSHRNTNAYVQREMNNILRKYSWVKTYIDDVIVFSKTLNDHIQHLTQLFALFQHLNITLKTKKTYLKYSSISLLSQKIDSLNLIIAEDKLKAIVKLSFSKTLKNLKKISWHDRMIERLCHLLCSKSWIVAEAQDESAKKRLCQEKITKNL